MKRKFIIEVEEGASCCAECPLINIYKAAPNHELPCSNGLVNLCTQFDMSTLTIMDTRMGDQHKVDKAAQWLYDHLTTEYQGAVLKIVAKEKGLMPVEFVEKFKKAMEE